MSVLCLAILLVNVEPTEQVDGDASGELVTSDEAVAEAGPLPHPLTRAETIVVERTNTLREREELPPTERSESLDRTAQWFAEFMARTGQYGHEADGRTAAERIESSTYEACSSGENIAYVYRGPRKMSQPSIGKHFYNAWQKSPAHRANMLTGSFTETGVGIARSERGTYFAVQLFGRPKSQTVVVEVMNRTGRELSVVAKVGDRERGGSLPHRSSRVMAFCESFELTIGDRDPVRVSESTRFVATLENDQLTIEESGQPHEVTFDE